MYEFFANLFSSDGFPPRWHCGQWSEFHGWLYIVSDLGVWTAYTAIPAVLVYFVWQKATIPFRRIFWLFGAFILACGLTHLFDAIMFWWPAYRFLGLLELCTALVSWATVVALVPIVPQALALRSPRELEREIEARRRAEAELQRVNQELERRIAERTAELVQTNATLKREREWFQTTLVSIGDAVIATDTRGRITFINKAAEDLTGWSDGEAQNESLEVVFKIIDESSRQPAENPALRALAEGTIVGLANHTVLVSKGGREIPIDDSAAPIRDENQRTVGVVLVFRDVTERRKAELALRDNEERTRRLLEFHQAVTTNMGEGLYAVDSSGLVTYMNPAAEALFGWTERELLGLKMHEMTHHHHPDGRPFPAVDCAGLQVLERGTVLKDFEDHFIKKDGTFFPVSYSSAPLAARGNVEGQVVVFRDVSERKRAEGALCFLADASTTLASLADQRDTLQKLARLAIPFFADWCVVYLAKDDHSIVRAAVAHVDPAKEALLNELQERFPLSWDSPTPSAAVIRSGQADLASLVDAAQVRRNSINDEHFNLVERIKPRSHVFVPLLIRAKVVGAIGFLISESDRRFTQDDLVLAQELAGRAAVALENAGLYQELRTADRRKDEFLAMLAHELRNPLAPIRNALELLKIDHDPNTVNWAHQVMQRQVEHIVRLVDDLLDVSRIMQGKIQLKKQPLELSTAVSHAVEESKSDFKAQDQHLSLSLPSDAVWLNADPTRLSQIISNLLSNASKYTDRGGNVWLDAQTRDGRVIIRVRDTGIGIPRDMLNQIFEPFTQVSTSVDRARGGLGIGLSLVRSLVVMHGGTVEAHSEGLGKGSEFVVEIPTIEHRAREGKARWMPSPVPTRRVLVVDDNHGAAQTLTLLLQRLWKHEVETVNDGLTALEKVPQFRPTVVLLDIGLPGLSGYEVAKRIREMPEGRSILLVALTGYGQDEDKRRSAEAGFDLHLVKPITAETLQEVFLNPKLGG